VVPGRFGAAMRHAQIRERVVGCVLGLALGDALGAPFEFRRAEAVPDPLPAFELPWMGRSPGSTTDDTAMAVNLVRSLGQRGDLDPDDLVARHLAWFETGPPDVGTLTRLVLARVGSGVSAEEAARQLWEERGPEVSAGNGSVMYCAPLGVAYAQRPHELLGLAPRLSALTHHDERCRTAVLAVTLCVAALVRGERPRAAVPSAIRTVLGKDGGEELEFLVDAVGSARRIDGPDQGFCLYAAATGLQAAVRAGERISFGSETVEAELRRVVALGGDTDTNAAVAGALLGAATGKRSLPVSWLERLQGREELEVAAERLVPLALRR
jgi:ADP-ribosyl-[dinitrogen reductase] hydrolase